MNSGWGEEKKKKRSRLSRLLPLWRQLLWLLSAPRLLPDTSADIKSEATHSEHLQIFWIFHFNQFVPHDIPSPRKSSRNCNQPPERPSKEEYLESLQLTLVHTKRFVLFFLAQCIFLTPITEASVHQKCQILQKPKKNKINLNKAWITIISIFHASGVSLSVLWKKRSFPKSSIFKRAHRNLKHSSWSGWLRQTRMRHSRLERAGETFSRRIGEISSVQPRWCRHPATCRGASTRSGHGWFMAPADGKTSAAREKTHLKTTDAKRRDFKCVTAQRWRSFRRTTTGEPLSLLSLNHVFVVLYILWHKAPEAGQLSAQAFMHRVEAETAAAGAVLRVTCRKSEEPLSHFHFPALLRRNCAPHPSVTLSSCSLFFFSFFFITDSCGAASRCFGLFVWLVGWLVIF